MKKNDIAIGNTYTAKVTNRVVAVRIDAEHPGGGWAATNLATGKPVRIKSAQRLREAVKAHGASTASAGVVAKTAAMKRKGTAKPAAPEKLGLLEAAARVLAESGEPLNTKQMVERVVERGLWTPGSGKTPAATLYSSILRETNKEGGEARFAKVERGRFEAKKGA